MLTSEEIHRILAAIGRKIVVKATDAFPFEVSAPGFGYSDDPATGALQAKLSIMLEIANKAGR